MASKDILNRIKQATVALAMTPEAPPSDARRTPHTILGSGFCIDPAGIVVTCEHVVQAFVHKDMRKAASQIPDDERAKGPHRIQDLKIVRPHVLFFNTSRSQRHLFVVSPPIEGILSSMEIDLGLIRLGRSPEFPTSYPFVEIEDFTSLYEGMDVATCGFPMGNNLQDQAGTKTSSFTRGILSSIAPSPGTDEEFVKGFQLDITATHGNSGGPVFSWETGRVFGVLHGGPTQHDGSALPGIAFAEPVYRLFKDGLVEKAKVLPKLPA